MDGRGTPGQADKKDQTRTEHTLNKSQLHPLRGLSSNNIPNTLILRKENRKGAGTRAHQKPQCRWLDIPSEMTQLQFHNNTQLSPFYKTVCNFQ